MSKTITTLINRFSGGLSEDHRINSSNKFALTKHFDTFSYPNKLIPYFDTSAVEDKTYLITKFLYCLSAGSTYYVYGFGKNPATDKIRIYRIATDGSAWGAGANNASGLDKKEGCFFYYKGFIYMFGGTTKLIRYDVTGAAAFNDAYQTLTAFTTIAQPVHHQADDIAYFFTDNIIHKLDNTTWSEAVLTLPNNLKIVDACEYGDYLAIACAAKDGKSNSVVYLWDRDSSLTTLSKKIDFGNGTLLYIASLDNKLIGVSDFFIGDGSIGQKSGRLLIKQAVGETAIIINELINDYSNAAAGWGYSDKTKFVRNNKLYFPYIVPLNGDVRGGIWVVDSYGRATLDFIEEEVALATNKRYHGIFAIGNQWWIAHSADGSVNRADANSNYSATSIYESLIFNLGDSGLTKKLIGVTVMTKALPTAGQVVLKYQINENIGTTTWTTIFTNTTDNSISQDAINIGGATLPEFKEIAFQILSIGGAVITGFKFKAEIIDKQLY